MLNSICVNNYHQFFDLPTLGCLSATSRKAQEKCQRLWEAFAHSKVFAQIPLERFFNPKPREKESLERLKGMDLSCGQLIYRRAVECKSVHLLNTLHAACPELVRERFLIAMERAPDMRVIDMFLKSNVDFAKPLDTCGNTALMIATVQGRSQVINRVLEHFKDPEINPDRHARKHKIRSLLEARNQWGYTALMIAKLRYYAGIGGPEYRECIKHLVLASEGSTRWGVYRLKEYILVYANLVRFIIETIKCCIFFKAAT